MKILLNLIAYTGERLIHYTMTLWVRLFYTPNLKEKTR